MLSVKVRPKQSAPPAQKAPHLPVTVITVCDREIVRPPAAEGLCALIRERLLAGERLVLLPGPWPHGPDPAPTATRGLPGAGLPVPEVLASHERIGEELLRTTLVGRLVGEGIAALGLSGAGLGLLWRAEDGELRLEASLLRWMLSSGVVPVLGCDCLVGSGDVGRASSDEVLQALVRSLGVARVDALTRHDRLQELDGLQAMSLPRRDLLHLLQLDAAQRDPLLRAALEVTHGALECGVPVARIGSVASLAGGTATRVAIEPGEASAS